MKGMNVTMSYQDVFKRYEMKFLLNKEQKEAFLKGIEPYMQLDEYGRTTISNIYYDTPDDILIRRSLEKPVYKEKLRVRSYCTATPNSQVFVELKKKYQSVVYKRRISATEQDAMDYLNKKIPLEKANQITREIDYFCKFYEGLCPAMFISYEREAFFGKQDPQLRLTIDENILYRRDNLSLCKAAYGTPILERNQSLLEIKIAGAMPLWLSKILSDNKIYQTSFSKYGNAYLQELQKNETNGGKKYA